MEEGCLAKTSSGTSSRVAQLVSHLSADEQTAVRDFITFLRGQKETDSPFLSAIEEFIERHPELLRRLVL